jgi:hypothetical protein
MRVVAGETTFTPIRRNADARNRRSAMSASSTGWEHRSSVKIAVSRESERDSSLWLKTHAEASFRRHDYCSSQYLLPLRLQRMARYAAATLAMVMRYPRLAAPC